MRGKKWILALAVVLCLMGTAWAGEREIVYNLGIEPRTIDPILMIEIGRASCRERV